MNTNRLAPGVIFLISLAVAAGVAASDADPNIWCVEPMKHAEVDYAPAAEAYVKALSEIGDPSSFPGMPSPWPREVADTRAVARRLAEAQGKTIIPVLKMNGGREELHMLAFLTVDELRLRDEAVELALLWFFADSYSGDVLLPASFCSKPTREAIANVLLKRWSEGARSVTDPPESFAAFLAAVGNAETADLLRAYDRKVAERVTEGGKESGVTSDRVSPRQKQREARARSAFLWAAERTTMRLALPKEAAAGRARDDLLFWQTMRYARRSIGGTDYRFSARSLVAGGYRISSDYLIELFESKDRPAFLDPSVAIEIVQAQREYATIPAMVGLVKREPRYRERVEKALREMGTLEAEKGLQEIDVYCW